MGRTVTATQETVVLDGHIIDSLLLPKVLDTILMMGGTFDLADVAIGTRREEPSHARIVVRADTPEHLAAVLQAIQPHGATIENDTDCAVEAAPADGVLPERFYATTHLPTQVRLHGDWIEVRDVEMDVAIRVAPDGRTVSTVPMADVKKGDRIVVGRRGVRVTPLERPSERDVFSFMEAQVSSERPNTYAIADIAARMRALKGQREAGAPAPGSS